MRDAPARIQGAMVGLGVVALAAVFFFVLAPLLPKTAKAAGAARAMTLAQIKSALGDYDQKFNCADLGAPASWRGYVWLKADVTGQPTAAVIVCQR